MSGNHRGCTCYFPSSHVLPLPASPGARATFLVHLLIESVPPPETVFSGTQTLEWKPQHADEDRPAVFIAIGSSLPFQRPLMASRNHGGSNATSLSVTVSLKVRVIFVIASVVRKMSYSANYSGVFLDVEPTLVPH